jgi:hypothetical protein
MGMQGASQPLLPISMALQGSEEDVMEIVRWFREIKKVAFDLADAGIPSET